MGYPHLCRAVSDCSEVLLTCLLYQPWYILVGKREKVFPSFGLLLLSFNR